MAALCQGLGACSMVPSVGANIDQEPTGSISSPIAAVAGNVAARPDFPASLDAEDRRRALGALAIALDPQGNGATVRWDNPVSKAHGSVTPAGFAYPANNLICRGFSTDMETREGARSASGAACRDKDAQWSLTEFHLAGKS